MEFEINNSGARPVSLSEDPIFMATLSIVSIARSLLYKEVIITRATLGADGATSQIVKTKNRFTDETIKVIHRVIKDGKIIHLDQKFP